MSTLSLPAGVTQVSANTFVRTVNTVNCNTTIAGYCFAQMAYAEAWDVYFRLKAAGYPDLPPVTSVSVQATVSGTVVTGDTDRSSWG